MSETPSSDTQPGIDDCLDNESSSASDKKDDGPVEFQDPAILCQRRGNSPTTTSFNDRRFRYTNSELKAFRDDPLCKRVPDCFDSRLIIWRRFGRGGEEETSGGGGGPPNGRERGEPRERRIYDNGGGSRGEMKRGGGERGGGGDKDPRERLKKEDNIILSPQRRSFNMGCQMPAAPAFNATPALGSALLRNDRDIINGGRDRRIGSGRILARDVAWDYRPEKGDPESETPSTFTNYRGSGANSGSNAPPSNRDYRERDEKPPYESRRSSNNYENSRGGGSNNRDYDSRDKESNSYQSSRQYGDRNSRYNNSRSSYNDRRRYSEKDEEPEWFSAGPTSQLETIDLHGFDGPIGEEKEGGRKEKNTEKGGTKGSKSENHEKSSRDDDRMKSERSEGETHQRGEPNNNPKANDTNNNKDQDGKFPSGGDSQKQLLGEVLGNDGDDFNFEEFLNFESITGLLASNQETNQASREQAAGGGSRFSQWFSRDSPTKMVGKKGLFDSRRSSLHDELNNLIGDMSNEMKAPGHQLHQNQESNKYFAPISPAANTANARLAFLETFGDAMAKRYGKTPADIKEAMHGPNMDSRNLMFLMEQQKSSGMNSPSMSQMPSVEELEARLRGGEPSPTVPNNGPRIVASTNNIGGKPNMPRMPMLDSETGVPGVLPDTIAFKRLLAQMSDGIPGVGPPMNPNLQQIQQQQQANLIQMLSAKQGQNGPNTDELKKIFNFMQQMQGANGPMPPQGRPIQGQKQQPPAPAPAPSGQDNLANMLHVNQIPTPHNLQPDLRNAEILKRPEAQLLIQSIIRGEMKPGNLWQQMSNPTITPRQRETLTAVLNSFNSSPRVSSPNLLIPPPGSAPIPPLVPNGGLNPDLQAQILLQQQKQQMRVSPLPNGMPQRIPSPRELQYHTQSIMQNALIRKKLEEQRENFRKRQEAQQAQQSQQNPSSATTNIGTNPATITPAPTSVAQPQAISQANPVHSSPVKHTQSPTPLAFTPTSVLRKMTADKGPDDVNSASSIVSSSAGSSALLNSIANAGSNKGNQQLPQRMPQNTPLNVQMGNLQLGQPIRGVPQRNPIPQQQQPPQVPLGGAGHQHMQGSAAANMAWLQQQMQAAQAANQVPKPQVGRPIVKQQSSVPGQPPNPVANPAMMPPFNQQNFDFNAVMQQQQRKTQPPIANNPGAAPGNNLQQGGGGGNSALTAHQIQQLMAHRQQVQAAQVQQQQQKYLEMQRYRQMMEQQQQQQQQPPRPGAGPIPGENPLGDRGIMNFGRDGNLSPTSNQLARWFSPELLAQASASKNNINLTQALSLEELERSMQHSSTTVHN